MKHYVPSFEILLSVIHEIRISRCMRCASHTVRDVHLVHHSLTPFTSFPQVFHRKGNSVSVPVFLLLCLLCGLCHPLQAQTLSGTIRDAEDSRPMDAVMVSVLRDGVMIDYALTGERYNQVNNSLNAKAVKTAEIMENYQSVKALKGKINSDEVALNLKLDPKARDQWIMNGTLGTGRSDAAKGKDTSGGKNGILWEGSASALQLGRGKQNLYNYKTNNKGKDLSNEQALLTNREEKGISQSDVSNLSIYMAPYFQLERGKWMGSLRLPFRGKRFFNPKGNYFLYSPSFYLRCQVNHRWKLTLFASLNRSAGDGTDLYPLTYRTDYRTWRDNNRLIPVSLSRNYQIYGEYKNTVQEFFVTASLYYQRVRQNTIHEQTAIRISIHCLQMHPSFTGQGNGDWRAASTICSTKRNMPIPPTRPHKAILHD